MRDEGIPATGARAPVALLLAAVLLITPRALDAQISPGPLSRAHASLDGALGCAKCHAGGRQSGSQRCLACHREIGSLRDQRRGYHAREGRGECASCHPEHAGRDFDLIRWPQGTASRFDHRAAGWALEGGHQQTRCAGCHMADFRVDPVVNLAPRRDGVHWIGLQQRCTACHDDPHRASLGARCESCHDIRAWKPAPRFDHDQTEYPLTGRHDRVECGGCHLAPRLRPRIDSAGRPVPVFKPVPAADCSSCHSDPHQGRLAGRCSSCHVTSGFRTISTAAFSHDRTRYPLTGKHVAVPCAGCHRSSPRRVERPPFATCAACHSDPHRGQATAAGRVVDCAACHRVQGFSPSTFTVAQHAASAFPLKGAHASVRCSLCHAKSVTGAGGGARVTVELRPRFQRCADCHADPHGPWLANTTVTACEGCHTERSFRPSLVDVGTHVRFRFTLEGAHRTVPCSGCHTELARSPAVRRSGVSTFGAPAICASCHQTPHGDQFDLRADRGACEACHTAAAFRPATRFDHEIGSRFPLAPTHTRVPCASCHRRSGGATTPVTYRGTPVRCMDCHSGSGR